MHMAHLLRLMVLFFGIPLILLPCVGGGLVFVRAMERWL